MLPAIRPGIESAGIGKQTYGLADEDVLREL